jgi:hypothetical protein
MDRLMSLGTLSRPLGLAAVAACLFCGCGGEDGYHVSGKVTFDGKPVPAGMIYFTPDGAQNNEGPTGYAAIVDGEYDTSADGGKPVAGGPMIVRIDGNDPTVKAQPAPGDTSGEVLVQTLFPTYETTADLPKDDTTQDFDVPAEAAHRVSVGERPMIVP